MALCPRAHHSLDLYSSQGTHLLILISFLDVLGTYLTFSAYMLNCCSGLLKFAGDRYHSNSFSICNSVLLAQIKYRGKV